MTLEELQRMPKFDTHAHIRGPLGKDEGQFVALLKRHNLKWLDICVVGTEWEKGSPQIDAFKKRLTTLYPGKPYGFIFVVAYEPLFMLKAGMEKAGTVTDIDKIAAAMETAVTPKTSPAGLFTKVVKGEVELNLYPVEIRNGEIIAVK